MKLTRDQVCALANQLEKDEVKRTAELRDKAMKSPKFTKAKKELNAKWLLLDKRLRDAIENSYGLKIDNYIERIALEISGFKADSLDRNKSSWEWQREIHVASIDSASMDEIMKKLGR